MAGPTAGDGGSVGPSLLRKFGVLHESTWRCESLGAWRRNPEGEEGAGRGKKEGGEEAREVRASRTVCRQALWAGRGFPRQLLPGRSVSVSGCVCVCVCVCVCRYACVNTCVPTHTHTHTRLGHLGKVRARLSQGPGTVPHLRHSLLPARARHPPTTRRGKSTTQLLKIAGCHACSFSPPCWLSHLADGGRGREG